MGAQTAPEAETYQRELAALIADPSLAAQTGPAIVAKARFIKDHGHRAAHDDRRAPSIQDAAATVSALFHVCFWVARTARPDSARACDKAKLEDSMTIGASTVAQIQKIQEEVKAARKRADEAAASRRSTEQGVKAVEAELAAAQSRISGQRHAQPDGGGIRRLCAVGG